MNFMLIQNECKPLLKLKKDKLKRKILGKLYEAVLKVLLMLLSWNYKNAYIIILISCIETANDIYVYFENVSVTLSKLILVIRIKVYILFILCTFIDNFQRNFVQVFRRKLNYVFKKKEAKDFLVIFEKLNCVTRIKLSFIS